MKQIEAETSSYNEASTENASSTQNANKERRGVTVGACVLIVLREPREKCWGRLDGLSQAGVFVRGLEIAAFDDWTHGLVRGENELSLADLFFPLWRVERIARDEPSGTVPALYQQLAARTGLNVNQAFDLIGNEVIDNAVIIDNANVD